MTLRPTKSEPVRALIAVGAGGSAVVLATDSPWLTFDIDAITDRCDDLGIEAPRDRGLWLWEGVAKEGLRIGLEQYESGTDYEGRCRRPEAHELPELLEMEAPELCGICGKPATTYYPPDDADGEPSCGAAACELRMQAAQDYHDERGG